MPAQSNTNTTPEKDEATDTVPASHPPNVPYGDMKLPHERDESGVGEATEAHDPAQRRPAVEQAQRDVTSGKQDTDCYDAVAPRFEKQHQGGGRGHGGGRRD